MTKEEKIPIIPFKEGDTQYKFIITFPFHKRIWRLLMLIIRGWCYFD